MAEVSSERIYEVLKQLRDRQISTEAKVDQLKSEMPAFRGHMVALQQDTQNIYAILARHDVRLDRIELREPATA